MSQTSRRYPRIEADCKMEYEFVNWKEKELESLKSPQSVNISDISTNGLGVKNLPAIDDKMVKLLEKGKKKVKIALHLYDDCPPFLAFARLVWNQANDNGEKRFGFMFISVTEEFYTAVNNYVNSKVPVPN